MTQQEFSEKQDEKFGGPAAPGPMSRMERQDVPLTCPECNKEALRAASRCPKCSGVFLLDRSPGADRTKANCPKCGANYYDEWRKIHQERKKK